MKAQVCRTNLWQDESASEAFTPALILFIALPEVKDNSLEPG